MSSSASRPEAESLFDGCIGVTFRVRVPGSPERTALLELKLYWPSMFDTLGSESSLRVNIICQYKTVFNI